jgi:hypothetical protein
MTGPYRRPQQPLRRGGRFDARAIAAAVALVGLVAAGAWLAASAPSSGRVSQGLTWRYREAPVAEGQSPGEPIIAVAAGAGYAGICFGTDAPDGRGYCTSPDGLEWQVDRPPWLPSSVVISSFAGGEAGYVLVGSADEMLTEPAAYFSTDARTWQAASISGDQKSGIYDAAAGPGGFLAIGGDGTGEDTGPMSVWRSSDGRTWSASTSPSNGRGTLFSTGTAYLVAVADQAPVKGQLPMWRSGDGQTWQRASVAEQLTVASFDDVVRLADGSLLATVRLDEASAAGSASSQRLLRSADDGRTWTVFHVSADTTPVSLGHGVPVSLVRVGGVLLGLATDPAVDATTVAVSNDGGASWDPLVDPVDPGVSGEPGAYDAPLPLGDAVFIGETYFGVDGSRTIFWVGHAGPGGGAGWLPQVLAVAAGAAAAACLAYLLWRWRPSRIRGLR